MNTKAYSILDLRTKSLDWMMAILQRAKEIETQLQNKTWQAPFKDQVALNLFFEESTRTRISFEMALHHLGIKSIAFDVKMSSNKKGESLQDMVQNLEALGVSAFIVRHSSPGAVHEIDAVVSCPVINAGDGINEHPTQALLDIYTLQSYWAHHFKEKKVLICGDIKHSRVAHSNIWALNKLGVKVYVTGPASLMPKNLGDFAVEYVKDLDSILPEVDAINVLRIQAERQAAEDLQNSQQYREQFGLTLERLRKCAPKTLILHPGPMNRGVEIDSEVAESPQTVILEQVKKGVFVRMACIEYCLSFYA